MVLDNTRGCVRIIFEGAMRFGGILLMDNILVMLDMWTWSRSGVVIGYGEQGKGEISHVIDGVSNS